MDTNVIASLSAPMYAWNCEEWCYVLQKMYRPSTFGDKIPLYFTFPEYKFDIDVTWKGCGIKPYGVILLVCGGNSFAGMLGEVLFQKWVWIFSKAGYATCLIDLAGSGERIYPEKDQKRGTDWLNHATSDIRTAIDYIVERKDVDSKNIHIMGFSLGAHVASKTLTREPRIRSAMYMSVSGMSTASVTNIPILLIVKRQDFVVSRSVPDIELDTRETVAQANCKVKVVLLDGKEHAFQPSEVKDHVLNFLRENTCFDCAVKNSK